MTTNAVLFDLDGTLLDRARSLRAFAEAQYERFSGEITPRLSREAFITRLIDLDDHGRVWKDEVYRRIFQESGITDLDWRDLLSDYETGFCRCCLGFDGLKDVVSKLKADGLQLGLVSNGPSPFQERNFEALGVSEAFDTLVVSEAVGFRKPDPRIFRLALERLGRTAEETVFVGDNPDADIAGAKGAGLRAVWMRNPHWPECGAADASCDRLRDLPPILEKLA